MSAYQLHQTPAASAGRLTKGQSTQKIHAPDFTPPVGRSTSSNAMNPMTSVARPSSGQSTNNVSSAKLFADSAATNQRSGLNASTAPRSSMKSASKKKSSNASQSGANNAMDSAATPAVRQAKEDLLRLGIELDDELITRLQNNLGIDKIFEVAHQAATILAPQPSLDLAANNQEISFRHVSANGHGKVGFSLDTRQPVHASLQPFVSDLIALNPKHSIQILKQLDNRADEIEPQYRPLLDHLIQSFRLQYARAPCRFIGRLLGRKWNSATDKTQEESLITRWVLKTRYVTKQDFTTMIQRVAPKAKPEVIQTMFVLLREEKQFGNPQKHAIVDLWAFLTLLKTASEESRRSFDGAKSKLANEVEFWRETNTGGVRAIYGGSPTTTGEDMMTTTNDDHYHPASGTHPRTGLPPQPPIEEGWRLFENIESENIRHVHDTSQPISHGKKMPKGVTSSSSSSSGKGPASVATLLGQPHYRHLAETSSGRAVLGRFHNEVTNTCDIPSALNSPPQLQRRPRPSTAHLPHDLLQREEALPIPPAQYVHDSRNVAYLLNNREYITQTMAVERPPAANILQREMLNNTSVAYALGKDTAATAQAEWQRRAARKAAVSASSLGNVMQQRADRDSNGNSNNGSSRNSNRNGPLTVNAAGTSTGQPPRAASAGRMRLSSVHDLHWESGRASVAAALGGGGGH